MFNMPFNKDYDYIFKILIIGDSYVGKSSLLSKYADNIFDENFNATIGVDFKSKHLDIDDKMVKLQIWDSSGEKIFKSISTLYYKNCHGIMIVFDVTNKNSFQNIKIWLNDIKQHCRVDDIPKILVGNKTDKDRIIPYEEIIEFANLMNLIYIETSAKDDKNIDRAFKELSIEIKSDFKRIEKFFIKKNVDDTIKLNNKPRSCCFSTGKDTCY